MSDLTNLYNPANAGTLTPEQLKGLQELTSAQIRELAQAYPNHTMQRTYLLIIDGKKKITEQLPQLSSFQNLYNLREANGQKQWVAFAFRANYKPAQINPKRKVEVRDLSETELQFLPGFKKPMPETETKGTQDLPVPVTKVKRIKK